MENYNVFSKLKAFLFVVQPSSAHCWADYFQTVRGCQAKDAETWKFKCSVEKMDNSKASPLHKR